MGNQQSGPNNGRNSDYSEDDEEELDLSLVKN